MLLKAYSIYDATIREFDAPIFAKTDEQIKRSFSDSISKDFDSLYAKHPEQFILFCVGVFDSDLGCFISYKELRTDAEDDSEKLGFPYVVISAADALARSYRVASSDVE